CKTEGCPTKTTGGRDYCGACNKKRAYNVCQEPNCENRTLGTHCRAHKGAPCTWPSCTIWTRRGRCHYHTEKYMEYHRQKSQEHRDRKRAEQGLPVHGLKAIHEQGASL